MPGITVEIVKEAVMKAFTDEYGQAGEIVNFRAEDKEMWPDDATFRDIMARNSSWEWCYGETPDFDIYLKNRFTWGGIELYFKLDEGIIKKAEIYSDALCEEIITELPGIFINTRFIGKELSQKLNDSKGTLSVLLKDRDSEDMVLNDLAEWLKNEL
jgi:lipoate-protein ligase A